MPTLDNPDNSLIVASRRDLPTFEMNVWAREEKQKALESAALIGKVTDRDSKIIAVRAQQHLKKVIADIEKARKQLKEPLLAAGRQLDNLCATETLELEKEFGRVSFCVREFDDAERRRVAEEERLQRLELERIEAQKQAELKRLEEEAAAGKIAADEAARIAQAIEEKSGEATYCAAKPIEITTVKGQRQTSNWQITVENPYMLAKFHPDLVEIKPKIADIKCALNEGREIKGIKAVKVFTSDVRVTPDLKAIDV